MKIYGISALGADMRVFQYLALDCDFIPVKWIEPKKNENIELYAGRLSQVISKNEPFGILGVCFGGLIAIEISKILKPEITILISSPETKDELRPLFRTIGKLNFIKMLPAKMFDPPRKITHFIFGTENKGLLNQILDDTNLNFAKWAVDELVNWKNEIRIKGCLKIRGSNDKLIPTLKSDEVKFIEGGEHLIIVDRAREISAIINEEINKIQHHNTMQMPLEN